MSIRNWLPALLLALPFWGMAQIENPVRWSFSAKKISTGTYEVHFTAVMDKGWHIYSQSTPDGGPVPTRFSFMRNPLLNLDATVKENGRLEEHHEPLFGVNVKQYSAKVVFVQRVTLKGKVKTSLTGSLEFMACNDSKCLPPKSVPFSVALQ